MAELILTEEERAAALWSDLDDASLGRLLKKHISSFSNAAEQLERTTILAAALMLCCETAAQGSDTAVLDLDGVTDADREFGDWRITVARRQEAQEPGA